MFVADEVANDSSFAFLWKTAALFAGHPVPN